MSGSGSGVASRPCWQRSPRSQLPTKSHNISSSDELDSLLAINEDSRLPLLLFIGSENPYKLLVATAMERLATLYIKRVLFCIIDMSRLEESVSKPIAEKYKVNFDHTATVVLLKEGEIKSSLELPLGSEKQILENYIREQFDLPLLTDPGFGYGGFHTAENPWTVQNIITIFDL
ncbi:hypothetical protein TWF281_001554 [Arthrobotrys megalospora]